MIAFPANTERDQGKQGYAGLDSGRNGSWLWKSIIEGAKLLAIDSG
jgi:hypothetical protein